MDFCPGESQKSVLTLRVLLGEVGWENHLESAS